MRGKLSAWLAAIRPRTLTITVAPVAVGAAIALHDRGTLADGPLAATLAGGLLIQIGTNLHNDAADFERGVDTPDRPGPKRAVAEGWLTSSQVRGAALLSLLLAFACGVYLAWVGGWPIVLLGLASLAAAWGYTGGPRPIAYTPLGELFVLLFFGVAAVAGTYYLQTGTLTPPVTLAGLVIGLPAAGVLLINNYRDLESDCRAGRRTLVAAIGRTGARRLYGTLLFSAPLAAWWLAPPSALSWLPLLTLPIALALTRRLGRLQPGPDLNPLLGETARFEMVLALLMVVGWLAAG